MHLTDGPAPGREATWRPPYHGGFRNVLLKLLRNALLKSLRNALLKSLHNALCNALLKTLLKALLIHYAMHYAIRSRNSFCNSILRYML